MTSLALGREEPFRQRRAEQITALVAAALFMENLDSTVIVPALPQMARSFGTNPVGLNIGVTAYTLILAVFIPISGWMADRFGARRVFAAATLALRHLRSAEQPLIPLAALRIPTYAMTLRGGSLLRVSVTMVPFLLLTMFQLGFGLDPFASGLLVLPLFAGSVGV